MSKIKNEHGLKIKSCIFLKVRFYYVEKDGVTIASFKNRKEAETFIDQYKVT